jgi:hypothetical protein
VAEQLRFELDPDLHPASASLPDRHGPRRHLRRRATARASFARGLARREAAATSWDMNDYAAHVRATHQRKQLRGVPNLSSPLQRDDVTPSVRAALSAMVPLPDRPPQAANRWDLKVVDRKHRVALTIGKTALGWQPGTTLHVLLDGPCLVLTEQADAQAVAEVELTDKQARMVVPRHLSDPLRLTPGQQVFLEADQHTHQLRLHPAGLVEVAATVAVRRPTMAEVAA